METLSALLALCAENSPVTGEFPPQRPVTQSFDVFFDLRLNRRLKKQSRRRWFEMPSRWLWRHCNVVLHPKKYAHSWCVAAFCGKLLPNSFIHTIRRYVPDIVLMRIKQPWIMSINSSHESTKNYYHYNNVTRVMASQITDVLIVCSTVCSGAYKRKHPRIFRVTGFCEGIHRWPVNSPHKGQ